MTKSDGPKKRRDWAFTDFNMDNKAKYAKLVEDNICRYACVGIEYCPTTNKPHLQGYLYFKNARNFREGRCVFGKTHAKFCWRPREDNKAYCEKDGKILGENFFEWGTFPSQGQRTDIEDCEYILKTTRNIVDIAENHFNLYIQYERRFKQYLEDTASSRSEMTKCYWYYGLAGAGKSTYIKNKYFGTDVVWLEYDGKYFSDYNQHGVVIFDDQNIHNFSRSLILKLINHTPYKIRCMGTYKEFVAHTIIFIDNFHYNYYFGCNDEAINRRIKAISFDGLRPRHAHSDESESRATTN